MNKYLFLTRVFNDIDHIVPIVWKIRKEGHDAEIIFVDKNSNLDLNQDPRFVYLRKETNCSIRYYYALKESLFRFSNRPLLNFRNPISKRLLKILLFIVNRFLFTQLWADSIIHKIAPKVLITDTQSLNSKTIEGKFLIAAKKQHIPILFVPHGVNIFTNFDVTEKRKAMVGKPISDLKDPYEICDKLAEQNPIQVPLLEKEGIPKEKIAVLGSARYSPEWIKLNNNIWPKYTPRQRVSESQLKILFFLPRWDQMSDKSGTFNAIEKILKMDYIFLVLKEHTREGAGSIPGEFLIKYRNHPSLEILGNEIPISFVQWLFKTEGGKAQHNISSTALILWSDIVVNFGSSIGIEALLQNKLLINPMYLHKNATIFESTGAGVVAKSDRELLKAVENFRSRRDHFPYTSDLCLETTVFGGDKNRNVLNAYRDLIVNMGNRAAINSRINQ